MTRGLLMLWRARTAPKAAWRADAAQHTLPPVNFGEAARAHWRNGAARQVELDSGAVDEKPLTDLPRWGLACFSFQPSQAEPGCYDMTLEGARLYGQPRRTRRPLPRLRPGQPVLIRLNERMADYSGQHYRVAEYWLLLGGGEALPAELAPARVVDLQEDLA
ncbi:MAG: hypothetical protein IT162_16530 [Bryobacterales bacterium]|nr:hypothetical protein [Bryobacterales bacterium]